MFGRIYTLLFFDSMCSCRMPSECSYFLFTIIYSLEIHLSHFRVWTQVVTLPGLMIHTNILQDTKFACTRAWFWVHISAHGQPGHLSNILLTLKLDPTVTLGHIVNSCNLFELNSTDLFLKKSYDSKSMQWLLLDLWSGWSSLGYRYLPSKIKKDSSPRSSLVGG